ncbi:hypothetical protein RSOL_446160 [Rhizoctonia solani AG-3 Rhs1AP]|uniref:Uncharacterized protein n=1 Tax=Rhizoctonia solani AG-3 Rhs1AP TaxID=1086054 RepID=X8JNA8_9AGAM|nr:hypothetical protein RSOL_446160 [Rhizoctonia solani AG-3 Rhs1AP]
MHLMALCAKYIPSSIKLLEFNFRPDLRRYHSHFNMRSDDVNCTSPLTPDSDSEREPETNVANENGSHDFVFDKADGDVELQLNNTLFKTRKYLINKFGVLAKLLRDTESTGQVSTSGATQLLRVTVKCDAQLIGDFINTNKILYASVIDGPFEFDTATLISALRIATVYGYDALRQFGISKLERANLSAIQRIKIAQELDVLHWIEPAFEELANRVEPIQPDEARILGIDSLLRVSNMREERRGRRSGDESTVISDTGSTLMGSRSHETPRAGSSMDDEQFDIDEDVVYNLGEPDDDLLGEKAKTRFVGIPVPAIRTYIPSKSRRQRLEVNFPDCTCTSPNAGDCVACRISPCLFKVLRSIQAQQMVHSDEIMNLQGMVSSLSF